MAYDPSVFINSQVTFRTTSRPYLNVALLTFAPSTSGFQTGFETNASFVDPNTLLGLGEELTINNYEQKLIGVFGATESEPIYQQVKGLFNPRGVADASGNRQPTNVTKPPRVFIAMRTRSVPWEQTIEFTTNTAGTVRITINPSRNLFDDGYLFQLDVVANGVLTVTQLRDNTVAALNADAGFAALYLAAPVCVLGEFTITSLRDGYPLVCKVTSTTGGPVMTNAVTTANTPGDYALDLDDAKRVLELQDDPITGKPERRYFFISDTQGDSTVNAEGYEWAQDEREAQVPRDYQFHGLSHDPLNFDPASAGTSEAEVAAAANGGIGWEYGSVCDHDLYEWPVACLFGRVIGYLPGEVSFTDKVLDGSVSEAKITPRDKGDDASLADDRRFNYNSPEGPLGSWRWGFLSNGSYVDRDWTAQYARYVAEQGLIAFKQQRSIVAFTDDDIEAGRAALTEALLTLPAVAQFPDDLLVTAVPRAGLDPNDIANRRYVDYVVTGIYGGVINRFGDLADPISITLSETLA